MPKKFNETLNETEEKWENNPENSEFEKFIERKIQNKTLYRHTFAGNDICNNCIYRRPWQNFCSKFKKKGTKNRAKKLWFSSFTL